MQIEMVRCAAEAALSARCDIARVVNAKFSGRIAPGETITVDGPVGRDEEGTRVTATLWVDGAVRATVSLVLRMADG